VYSRLSVIDEFRTSGKVTYQEMAGWFDVSDSRCRCNSGTMMSELFVTSYDDRVVELGEPGVVRGSLDVFRVEYQVYLE
jgi:hypothetical protein